MDLAFDVEQKKVVAGRLLTGRAQVGGATSASFCATLRTRRSRHWGAMYSHNTLKNFSG
jgi:hypothetical protein